MIWRTRMVLPTRRGPLSTVAGVNPSTTRRLTRSKGHRLKSLVGGPGSPCHHGLSERRYPSNSGVTRPEDVLRGVGSDLRIIRGYSGVGRAGIAQPDDRNQYTCVQRLRVPHAMIAAEWRDHAGGAILAGPLAPEREP